MATEYYVEDLYENLRRTLVELDRLPDPIVRFEVPIALYENLRVAPVEDPEAPPSQSCFTRLFLAGTPIIVVPYLDSGFVVVRRNRQGHDYPQYISAGSEP